MNKIEFWEKRLIDEVDEYFSENDLSRVMETLSQSLADRLKCLIEYNDKNPVIEIFRMSRLMAFLSALYEYRTHIK